MFDVTDQELIGFEHYRSMSPAPNPYKNKNYVNQEDWLTERAATTGVKYAPRNGEEAAQFLIKQHKSGSLDWYQLCLVLQRTARGIPPVYPSALTAAMATPESERVYKIEDLRRGMVAYCDDPNDSNPYGHIFFIIGRNKNGTVLTWSNDVKRRGGVDVVPLEFYANSWGDKFQFGATWLNGYDFSDFNKKPQPVRGTLGETYEHAIEDVRKSLRFHEKQGHEKIVKALTKDLERMRKHYKKFGVDVD